MLKKKLFFLFPQKEKNYFIFWLLYTIISCWKISKLFQWINLGIFLYMFLILRSEISPLFMAPELLWLMRALRADRELSVRPLTGLVTVCIASEWLLSRPLHTSSSEESEVVSPRNGDFRICAAFYKQK